MLSDADESKLTAWERWELASFEGSPTKTRTAQHEPAAVPPTAEDIERIKQQAQQAGYAAGQAQARAEAQRLGVVVKQLDAALAGFEQQVAEDLLGLALELARQVVRGAIVAKPELALEVIREALAQMPHPHAAIHLHPEDASLARLHLGDQLAHAGHRIHEDPRLPRGGCLIEAAGSQIDASMATRWRRIAESLGATSEWLDFEDGEAPPP